MIDGTWTPPGAALAGLALTLGLMALIWVASLRRQDASLVDRFWGLAFVVLIWWYAAALGSSGIVTALALVLVTIWGARLSLYITWRNWGRGEDYRYRAMREAGGPGWARRSLVTVFALQGALAWVIAMPLLAIVAGTRPAQPILLALGLGCWAIGMLFEAGGDWQLARFRADPVRRGAVLDTGLWRYTRHPNYFGDAMCWWGYFLLAASVGGWWTIGSPILMTVLLMKVSGAALLERNLTGTKPAYREYIRRTSAFWPRSPRD